MSPLSESARERQLYRYYQPWLDLQAVLNRTHDTVPSLNAAHHVPDPESCQDKALTAFAQLAALRLNVTRATISLITSSREIVLAEATRTLSLQSNTRHSPTDALSIGRSCGPRLEGVCQSALDSTYTTVGEEELYTADALVVGNLHNDDRFKDLDVVIQSLDTRFFAGVPITTREGYKIGVYSVTSDEPRLGLDKHELRFMEDVASTVFEHLELAKGRMDSVRGERMVRGLASFIEGKSFINSLPTANAVRTTDAQPTRTTRSQHGDSDESSTKLSSFDSTPGVPFALSSLFDRAARIIRESTLADGVLFFDASSGNLGERPPNRAPGDHPDSIHHNNDSTSSSSEAEHARPAYRPKRNTPNTSGSELSDNDAASSQIKVAKVLGSSVNSDASNAIEDAPGSLSFSEEDLGRCIRRFPYGKIFNFSERGTTSSGDDTNTSCSSPGQGQPARKSKEPHRGKGKKKVIRKFVAEEIIKVLPSVRSVVFLPLWDFAHERWFAAGFVWSTQVGRLMNPDDEFPYLKGFGNSIMSEVLRLDALAANHAKTTFIASISHELRSPLHGILGSIEFLRETFTDPFQTGLVTSIETCGKTLLDTIDHVLDYAKINNLRRITSNKFTKRGHVQSHNSSALSPQMNLTTDIDLAAVVEEVAEAVYAGKIAKSSSSGDLNTHDIPKAVTEANQSNLSSSLPTEAFSSNASQNPSSVVVVLDIPYRSSWLIRTQPGAIRRIVMNILGNALKYTNSGFVEISLHAGQSRRPSHLPIKIRCIDSGKGMSKDYQRDHLYRPFSQENPFSAGTGLGLSIVHQIAEVIGAKLDLKSVQGVGTEVNVSLDVVVPVASNRPSTNLESGLLEDVKGRKLCLLRPDARGLNDSHDGRSRFESSLRRTCEDWLGMETLEAQTMDEVVADIFVYPEAPTIRYLLENHGEGSIKGKRGKELPLLIVCTSVVEAVALRAGGVLHLSALGRVIEVIAQPCGPRKMAKVISMILRRACELQLHPSLAKLSPHTRPRQLLQIGSTDASANSPGPHTSPLNPPGKPVQVVSEAQTTRALSNPEADLEIVGIIQQDVVGSQSIVNPSTTPDPISTSPSPQHLRLPSGSPSPPATTSHILLVDDNPINLQLLITFMRRDSYTYTSATNGLEALSKYKEAATAAAAATPNTTSPFPFILMDISMPVMDGLEATREIRKFERESGIERATVIALTGLASEKAQTEAFGSGMDYFFTKPVRFAELRSLLEREG